jgi:hypothetical protein
MTQAPMCDFYREPLDPHVWLPSTSGYFLLHANT